MPKRIKTESCYKKELEELIQRYNALCRILDILEQENTLLTRSIKFFSTKITTQSPFTWRNGSNLKQQFSKVRRQNVKSIEEVTLDITRYQEFIRETQEIVEGYRNEKEEREYY